MSFRFRRSIKIAPGVRVNLSKSGASVSMGARGASISTGKRGTYANVGIPGTGLSYRQRIDDAPSRGGGRRARGPRDVSRRTVWISFGLLGLWVLFLVVHHWPKH